VRKPRTDTANPQFLAGGYFGGGDWVCFVGVDMTDPAVDFCHRFAILMERMVVSGDINKFWNEAATLLDEYYKAQDQWQRHIGESYVSGFGKDL
jgi:hypothetical protein